MKNLFMRAAAVASASVLLLGHPSGAFAAPPEHGGEHHQASAEDRAAFEDARIAALKAGLKMTPAQEKNWPALESVLRGVMEARRARMAEWREKAKAHHEHHDVIESLRQGAKGLAARAAEMERIADAAKPLYESLDDAQKHRFGVLLHATAHRHGHMAYMEYMMEHIGGHPDDHEGREHSE